MRGDAIGDCSDLYVTEIGLGGFTGLGFRTFPQAPETQKTPTRNLRTLNLTS